MTSYCINCQARKAQTMGTAKSGAMGVIGMLHQPTKEGCGRAATGKCG